MTQTRKPRGHLRGRRAGPRDVAELRALVGAKPRRRDLLIEYLHRIQDQRGYLPAAALTALADDLNLAVAEVFEVASFYHHFDLVKEHEAPPPQPTVRVCESVSCALAGAGELTGALRDELGTGVRVQTVPCIGRCDAAPAVAVDQYPVGRATVAKVLEAVEHDRRRAPSPKPVGFRAYAAAGGYSRLAELVGDRGPDACEEVLSQLDRAGLRGLGGAGFPTGRKWRIVRSQPAPRLLAVNIDEGEPGTFKDRYYLERDPHRFLEGMLIAAHVTGAEAVYIYLRDEYAGCRQMLAAEIGQLHANPPCPLPPIHLRRGAGAYICGEESAMLESIEGKRGMPRLRPPFVAERGLFDRPTLVNNLETLYRVREILERGADRTLAQGGGGLRAYSVSGRVRNPGVYEAPAGITARELIETRCGGMADGHRLKAYFPGGASGGILPAALADVPLDFDRLAEWGCFVGSGAVIVLSHRDSVRAAALNAMRFFAHESCGQCTPCRVGTAKAAGLMAEPAWDRALLEDLATVMEDASICGLGQAAPNPLRCAMKYFPEEFA